MHTKSRENKRPISQRALTQSRTARHARMTGAQEYEQVHPFTHDSPVSVQSLQDRQEEKKMPTERFVQVLFQCSKTNAE